MTGTDSTICGQCNLAIDDSVCESIQCDICESWVHAWEKCSKLKKTIFKLMKRADWACPSCMDFCKRRREDNLVIVLEEELKQVRDMNVLLFEENKTLVSKVHALKKINSRLNSSTKQLGKHNCHSTDLNGSLINNSVHAEQVSSLTDSFSINDSQTVSGTSESETTSWQTIPIKTNKPRPVPTMDYNLNPLVLGNKYSVLTNLTDDMCADSSRPRTTYDKHKSRPNLKVIQTQPSVVSKPKSIYCDKTKFGQVSNPKIHFYSDSQGRDVSKMFLQESGCNDNISFFVKRSAKLKQVVPSSHVEFKPDDFVVLLAGSNDVACNESSDLRRSLRRKLYELRLVKVIVFSVPLRYDLPEWSCVNEEVRKANVEIEKLSKHFVNCTFVDLSKLGKDFHTAHGLHLNWRGKKYICSKILEIVDNYCSIEGQTKSDPIPLPDKHVPSDFLAK